MQEQDVVSIDYLEDSARFADLINGYFYQGREEIHAGDIRLMNRSVPRISKEKRRENKLHVQVITADIVREVTHHMQVSVVALESQTDIHYAMPIRVMNLEGAQYHKQWRERARYHRQEKDIAGAEFISGFAKTDRLVPVITIVVYFGKESWDGPRSLKEMMNLEGYPEEMRNLITDYPIHILEVRKYKEITRFQTDLKYVFGFLQNEEQEEKLLVYMRKHEDAFKKLSEDAYDMISVMSHSYKLKEYKKMFLNKEGECDMCRAIDDMIEHGKQKARFELVMKMYHDGKIELSDACTYLECTEAEFYEEEKKVINM